MPQTLTKDTQAVLLLCGRFAPREQVQPLDLREYNRVVDQLHKLSRRPAFLFDPAAFDLDWSGAGVEISRLRELMNRGMGLALATERWANGGLWVISRSDDEYPARLRHHLGRNAPPLLWGVGERRLLHDGGIAIVGSREIDEDAVRWTEEVAAACVADGLTVISGGARGTDQVALSAALHAAGSAIGVLPEGLGKPSVVSRYRSAIVQERLTLISPFYPDAGFTVGNAMGRNKIIYGLANAAVIVRADAHKGGTWAGAEEELKRENRIPLFVRASEPMPSGNRALLAIGARRLPEPSCGRLIEILYDKVDSGVDLILDAPPNNETASTDRSARVLVEMKSFPTATENARPRIALDALSIYAAVLPVLLNTFAEPTTLKDAAERLDVQEKQLKIWVERATADGHIMTVKGRPIRFTTTTMTSDEPAPQKVLF
jgi:predicted Rossmann fold nucleotide-binding protein DprA/Smf involved in DNA uptake